MNLCSDCFELVEDDKQISPTWDEHDEMVRKVEEAFERSLEKFFSNRSELISKRKPGWRMSPPK